MKTKKRDYKNKLKSMLITSIKKDGSSWTTCYNGYQKNYSNVVLILKCREHKIIYDEYFFEILDVKKSSAEDRIVKFNCFSNLKLWYYYQVLKIKMKNREKDGQEKIKIENYKDYLSTLNDQLKVQLRSEKLKNLK